VPKIGHLSKYTMPLSTTGDYVTLYASLSAKNIEKISARQPNHICTYLSDENAVSL